MILAKRDPIVSFYKILFLDKIRSQKRMYLEEEILSSRVFHCFKTVCLGVLLFLNKIPLLKYCLATKIVLWNHFNICVPPLFINAKWSMLLKDDMSKMFGHFMLFFIKKNL